MPMHKARFQSLASFFLAALALGGEAVPNWSAPATWSPPRAAHGVATLGDISGPLPFIAVAPCRQYDSRNSSALPDNTNRAVILTGAPCNVPAAAAAGAVSVNITIFSIAGAGGNGVFQVGTAANPTFAWINYPPTESQRGNAGVLPLIGGQIVVKVNQGGGSLHFTVDLNGYYARSSATPNTFRWETFGAQNAIEGVTGSGSGVVFGISGQSSSTSAGAAGVEGFGNSGGTTYGVYGHTASVNPGAAGVRGVDGSGPPAGSGGGPNAGVRGEGGFGVVGLSNYFGVVGQVFNTSGAILAEGYVGRLINNTVPFGVVGYANASTTDSAGVRGVDSASPFASAGRSSAGVRGESGVSFGVLGLSNYIGVVGSLYNSTGLIAEGFLGSAYSPTGSPPWGVYSWGNSGASGMKNFVEPHPSDPTRVILYTSLEGREAGTYFRGTAHTVKGEAIIEIPDDFRTVTDEEGLTVQLTPMGDLATLAVIHKGLDRLLVRSSKDVTFDYLVQGVRRAFKDFEPVASGMEFAPRSPNDRMPAYLTEEAKRRLIANGTYNPDGTVNMQTAERVGWTRIWKEREERDKAAVQANAAARDASLRQGK